MKAKKKILTMLIAVVGCFVISSCSTPDNEKISSTIISIEKGALDRWGKGDPQGFLEIYADEITYFDPGTALRKDGKQVMTEDLEPIAGKIFIDKYDMINPLVQIHGDAAVLSYNLIDYSTGETGPDTTRWNSSSVYAKINNEWKMIHSHWSLIKPSAQNNIDL